MKIVFDQQDKEIIELDPGFSSTRLVTRKKPEIFHDLSIQSSSILFLPPTPKRKGEGGLRTKGFFKQSYSNDHISLIHFPLPLITIVTIVRNGEKYLEQTIQSVIDQTYPNVEYIVVDGGSTDNTLDIIRQYEDKIDYWVSEPDKGIADAMNKGIDLAMGQLINHLHAGDQFASESILSDIVSSYNSEYWRWCFGNQDFVHPSGEIIGCMIPPKYSQKLLHIFNTIPHQTVFLEKSLIQEVGYFDNCYSCAMDYHLWLRFSKIIPPKQFNFTIANFLLGGRSSNIKLALQEEFQARSVVLKQSPLDVLITVGVALIRYIMRKLRITTFVKHYSSSPKNQFV
jgi:glycosyltransferase involved in cell wall biosynthesis